LKKAAPGGVGARMRRAVWAGGAHKHQHGFVSGAVALHSVCAPFSVHILTTSTTIIDTNNNTESCNLLLLYLSQ
jgi:hypothetical protein